MRLIRLGALVGSVVLLVATTVSLVNERSELRQRQDARVVAAVQFAEQSAWAITGRAIAVASAANAATDPGDLVTSFGPGTSACVAAGAEQRCTDADLLALPAFGDAAAAAVEQGGAALAVDGSSGSLLVVTRSQAATTVIRMPADELVGGSAESVLDEYRAVVDLQLSSTPVSELARVGPERTDGDVVVTDTLPLHGDDVSIEVSARIADDVGLAGENLGLYLALLALGTILMGLAGWTFLIDRRSLERRATTDELTGLANRREFERQTDEALFSADRFATGVCVMLIDLNGFKQINDTRGHLFGDLVLQAAADRLRGAVRETDLVARWGGDEFVILLPGIEDGTGVRASAERIGRSFGDTPIVNDVEVTAAIGAALFPRHGTTLDELIRAADLAMYSAKSTGVTYRIADRLDVTPDEEPPPGPAYEGPDRRRPGPDDRARLVEREDARP